MSKGKLWLGQIIPVAIVNSGSGRSFMKVCYRPHADLDEGLLWVDCCQSCLSRAVPRSEVEHPNFL